MMSTMNGMFIGKCFIKRRHFWLRSVSHALNNPDSQHVLYVVDQVNSYTDNTGAWQDLFKAIDSLK